MTSPSPSSAVSTAADNAAKPQPESPNSQSDGRQFKPVWIALIAVVVVFGVGLLWLWQQVRDRDPGATERAGQSERMTALANRVEELAKIPTFADPVTVDRLEAETAELNSRMSENAAGVAAIGEQVAVRVTTVDARLSSQADKQAALTEQVTQSTAALSERIDTADQAIASVTGQAAATATALGSMTTKQTQDAAAASDRLGTLDGQVAGLDQRLTKIETWIKRAQPARVAEQLVALAELRRLIDAGNAFSGPLKRVQASVQGAASLSTDSGWAAYASTGIPTAAALSQSMTAIQKNHRQASTVETGSEWANSAVNSLLKGVRLDDKPVLGTDPVADALRAAQKALAAGDLDAADAAVAPIAEQVPAVVEWRKALTARRDATAAVATWDQAVLAGISEASQ